MYDKTLLSGFLLIDKPAGMSSFDVIRNLRRQTGIRTFGHAGTLDPFATGLLIIAVNRYTRLLSLLEFANKEYTASMILGTETSTGDPEGEVIRTSEQNITSEDLVDLKSKVLQISKLKPPLHSAVKVNGVRAYAKARAKEDFDLPERAAMVYEFDILEFNFPKLIYHCKVSKGTYIRSLSQWIAESLGTIGHTEELRRTAIGEVSLQRAFQLSEITNDTIESKLVSILDILPGLESINLMADELKRIKNGNFVPNEGQDALQVVIFDENSVCQGVGFRKNNLLYPRVNLI